MIIMHIPNIPTVFENSNNNARSIKDIIKKKATMLEVRVTNLSFPLLNFSEIL